MAAASGAALGAILLSLLVRILWSTPTINAVHGRPVLSPRAAPSGAPPSRPEPPPKPLTATEVVALDPPACEQLLRERSIPHEAANEGEAKSVRQPLRLRGPIRGVRFVPTGLASATEMGYDIADCRLLLALDGLAQIAKAHSFSGIDFFSIYRPSRPGRKAGRHAEGLAIDVGGFHSKPGGDPILVLTTFQPTVGAKPCTDDGDLASRAPTEGEAHRLWRLACDVYAARLFHVVLTPNEGPQHRDHFHFDLTTGADWFHLE